MGLILFGGVLGGMLQVLVVRGGADEAADTARDLLAARGHTVIEVAMTCGERAWPAVSLAPALVLMASTECEPLLLCQEIRRAWGDDVVLFGLAEDGHAGAALLDLGADGFLVRSEAGGWAARLAAAERHAKAIAARRAAEQVLAAKEEQLHDFVEHATDMIYAHSLDGRITTANGTASRVTGYAQHELIGMPLDNLIAPGWHALADEMTRRKLAGEAATTAYELEILTRDQRRLPIEVHTRLAYEDGQPVSVQGIARDISARRAAEASRREQEQTFQVLFAQHPHAMWVYDLETLQFLEVNGAASERYGYSRREFLAMQVTELVDAEARAAAREFFHALGTAVQGEWHHRLKGGRRITVKVHLLALQFGGRRAALAVAEDVTAERVALEQVARLATIVESSQEAIFSRDLDGRYVTWNRGAERLLGFAAKEMIGRRPQEIFPGEPAETEDPVWLRAVAGEAVEGIELARHRKDGRKVLVAASFCPLRASDGTVTGVATIARDITAQKAAEAENARLAAIVESSPDAIFSTDATGRVASWNAAAERLFGKDREAMLDASVLAVVPPERAGDFAEMAEIVSAGAEVQFETKVTNARSGVETPVAATVFPVFDAAHRLVSGAALFRDVSAQKAAEAEMARLASIVESSPDGIFRRTPEGIITSWNAGAERMFGYPAEYMIGRDIREVVPAERFGEVERIDRRLAAGSLLELLDTVRLTRDGRRLPVSLAVFAVRDGDGHVTAVAAICRDVSEQKAAERAVRESQERYQGIFDNTSDMISLIAVHDGGFVYEGLNPAYEAATGLTTAMIAGRSPEELLPAEIASQVTGNYRRCLAAGTAISYEQQLDMPAGSLTLITQLVPIRDEQGRIHRIAGISRDVTQRRHEEEERRQLELRIQQAQKLESLGVLAGGIAHDFNNLLVTILGNAGLSLMELPAESPVAEALHDIETAAHRAADLTRQMLAYSGRGRFVIEAVDLSHLVEEMAHLLEISISRGARLHYEFAPGLPAIEADATQLRQVVMNLISNASEALNGEEGAIAVRTGLVHADAQYLAGSYVEATAGEGDYVYLEVQDSGCGMDAATRARIFDPFFTTKFTGRGLGLAAVLGIVRGHHGTVHIDSELGLGTTFRVLFPLHAGQPENTALVPAEGEQQVTGGESVRRILLLEDDEGVRSITARILQGQGFAIETAQDHETAIRTFSHAPESYDAVLLDAARCPADAVQAFVALRQAHPTIPIVVASGLDEREHLREIAEQIAGFVEKPYAPERLVEVIQRAVGD